MSRSYLVDTNILLWVWHEPHRVPARLLDIMDTDARFLVSIISIWEINIKASIGRLVTVDHVAEAVKETGYEILDLSEDHVEAVRHLPLHHRDPYDRLIIAQAKTENLTVLATNRAFERYDIAIA